MHEERIAALMPLMLQFFPWPSLMYRSQNSHV